jgi:hypothetical protein
MGGVVLGLGQRMTAGAWKLGQIAIERDIHRPGDVPAPVLLSPAFGLAEIPAAVGETDRLVVEVFAESA